MTTVPSGKINDSDGNLIGFHITLADFHLLEQSLTNLAADVGTQPAYARGLFRAMGAFSRVLTAGSAPQSAIANPAHTVDWLNQIRNTNRQYQ